MKKIITALLALALAASMSVATFAENSATNTGSTGTDITVNGKFVPGPPSLDVISVDIVWDDMTFEFTEAEKVWNPKTHTYDQAAGKWSDEPKYITMTNHSNIALKIKVSTQGVGDITFNVDEEIHQLLSAEGLAAPDSTQTGLLVTGGSITESGKIGTVTVGIYKTDAIMSVFDLKDALENGGDVSIACDMKIGSYICSAKNSATTNFDLNGKKVTLNPGAELDKPRFEAYGEGTVLNVKNGTLYGTKLSYPLFSTGGAVINAENCTITHADGGAAVKIFNGASVTLKDCTVNGSIVFGTDLYGFEGVNTLTLSGNIVLNGDFYGEKLAGGVSTGDYTKYGKIICLAGTYNFDPTPYIDADSFTVSNDAETGIWTVAAK